MRYFPGHSALAKRPGGTNIWDGENENFTSDIRLFGRLTGHVTWRSEYLLRVRLLRSLARGRPDKKARNVGEKNSGVLTYGTKLPWVVTSLHANFSGGKRGPRVIHGSSDIGLATASNPFYGKVETFDDTVTLPSLDEVAPQLVPYGLEGGWAAAPNVIDVSEQYGSLSGEGWPGGRAWFKPLNNHGLFVLAEAPGASAEIPRVLDDHEAISSVWIAKSSIVPTVTESMIGMVTGSSLGVVRAYSLPPDKGLPSLRPASETARWILSPGVPIIRVKIDDSFSQRRRASGRVWAVALNALGEVFYLSNVPTMVKDCPKGKVIDSSWYSAQTVCWNLIEATRRRPNPSSMNDDARACYSPRSPSKLSKLGKEQLCAEAREMERFMNLAPAHFRDACDGWDMRRQLEVDFGGDDGKGAGEAVFVIDCGHVQKSTCMKRYTRALDSGGDEASGQVPGGSSIFGAGPAQQSGQPSPVGAAAVDAWTCSSYQLNEQNGTLVTAVAIDTSTHANLNMAEDPLRKSQTGTPADVTPKIIETAEIPGRRARLVALGFKNGAVMVWDGRAPVSDSVEPVRCIRTESPAVSSLALSSLYLVHGGSDGLVQAWDPLGSVLGALRTFNARASGRSPRHGFGQHPNRPDNPAAVGAIFLDPDPAALRGIVAYGSVVRTWSFSSSDSHSWKKRKLRHRHGDAQGRRSTRTVSGHIAAEAREVRREHERQAREQDRLRTRFGVGSLGDLTEEEAIMYAQMMSEESFMEDEQRRVSASETSSTYSGVSTPEPSLSGAKTEQAAVGLSSSEIDDDFEVQMQIATRLSLMDGVNDAGQSPRSHSSADLYFPIKFKAKGKKGKSGSPGSSPPGAAAWLAGESSRGK